MKNINSHWVEIILFDPNENPLTTPLSTPDIMTQASTTRRSTVGIILQYLSQFFFYHVETQIIVFNVYIE